MKNFLKSLALKAYLFVDVLLNDCSIMCDMEIYILFSFYQSLNSRIIAPLYVFVWLIRIHNTNSCHTICQFVCERYKLIIGMTTLHPRLSDDILYTFHIVCWFFFSVYPRICCIFILSSASIFRTQFSVLFTQQKKFLCGAIIVLHTKC